MAPTLFALDTLAQLPPTSKSIGYKGQKDKAFVENISQLKLFTAPKKPLTRHELKKKARSKYFSTGLAISLACIENSPLIKSYWNTFHCCGALEQKDGKVTGKYCGNRWCTTCNRVRTAKMIIGYSEPIRKMVRPHFVTLTVPNVRGEMLRHTIRKMTSAIRFIKKTDTKRGVEYIGLRKIECTYNKRTGDYHPHLHLVISRKLNGRLLIDQWLKLFPEARRKAQDIRKVDEKGATELFKYFTKLVTKTYKDGKAETKRVNINSLDIIFNSMRGMRVYQPMGILKNQKELERFIGQIKNTYKARKNPIQFNLIDLPQKKLSAIFTATMQINEDEKQGIVDKNKKIKLREKHSNTDMINFYDKLISKPQYEQKKKLCYEIQFTGVNMPVWLQNLKFRTFYKHEIIKQFTAVYNDWGAIDVSEKIENLFSQPIEGITDEECKWIWKKNDWVREFQETFDKETGEVVPALPDEKFTGYMPSDEMIKIVDTIEADKYSSPETVEVYAESIKKNKIIPPLQTNDSFLSTIGESVDEKEIFENINQFIVENL